MNPFPGDDMRRPAEVAAAAAAAGQPWGLAVAVPGLYASPPLSPANLPPAAPPAVPAAPAVPPAAPAAPAAPAEPPRPVLTEQQQAAVDAQLCVACRGGDLPKVRDALKKGASTSCQNAHGWRPLHNAAANGRADAIRVLVAAGADIHARDSYGWTALHDDAARGHADCVRELLKAGADKHGKDKAELTPIHLAKQNSHHAAHDVLEGRDAQKAAAGGPAPAKRKRPPKKKKGEAASPTGSASKKKKGAAAAPFTAPPKPELRSAITIARPGVGGPWGPVRLSGAFLPRPWPKRTAWSPARVRCCAAWTRLTPSFRTSKF